MSQEFNMEKECVLNTWTKREEKRKLTVRLGENQTEIDYVLIRKEN